MNLCPVCHMKVDEQEALRSRLSVYYAGHTYYFMCSRCKWAFLKDPEVYTLGMGRPATRATPSPCGGERMAGVEA